MVKRKKVDIPSYCDEEETISVKSEKDGILILIEKDDNSGKFFGTVSKVLEHIEADSYSDELFFGLLNKYYNNGENHKWVRVKK